MPWTELASCDKGSIGTPGDQYDIRRATVETNGLRYAVRIHEEWGSNRGYLECEGEEDRQYRADSLDELLRIAIASEKEREKPMDAVLDAIREAIYEAEDQPI
jgi:hypothetical protein